MSATPPVLSPEQLRILQHSLGVDKHGRGNQFRNHYVTASGCSNYDDVQSLVSLGLMQDGGPVSPQGVYRSYFVTDLGKKVMAEQSK